VLGAYVCQAVPPWLMTNAGLFIQVGDNCTAGQFEACSRHLARAECAVPPSGEAAGLAEMGQQAASPGKVCGFPPSGSLFGRGVADLAGVCAVRQTVKEPRHGGNGSLHCQDNITGELSNISWLEIRTEIDCKPHSQMVLAWNMFARRSVQLHACQEGPLLHGALLTTDAHTQRLFRPTTLPP
jgi:hypothetical protein